MKIVSWNVNSVKARLEHVKNYLKDPAPDVLMLQELKGLDFPTDEFEALGYSSVYKSQKAYNGVAILSKHPITLILNELPGDESDEQARYLEVEIQDIRLINIYLPNGNPIGTEKFDYKIAWMKRLKARLEYLRSEQTPFAIGGDFNVIPEDKDCYDPKAWTQDALAQPETRQMFRSFENMGLYDAFRICKKGAKNYTFWDYQAGAWPKDNGIRIDHFLLSPLLVDSLEACEIDKTPRGWDKPSDHTPIAIQIAA